MVDIGRVGIWTGVLDAHPAGEVIDLALQIEAQGWPTLWRPETTGRDALVSSALMLAATTRLNLATGIAQIHARHPHTMMAAAKTVYEASGERFLLGIGVSHGPLIEGVRGLEYRTPYQDMVRYVEGMKSAPYAAAGNSSPPFVLAALGPKMLRLAAEQASGAHPYFTTPEHTALARETMGAGPLLAPEIMVSIDPDVDQAREVAVLHMKRYLELPNYANNLRRLGFTDEDFAGPSKRVIDAVVACGDLEVAVDRVRQHHDAGADHVCIQVLTRSPRPAPLDEWQRLAEALGLSASGQ